MNRKKILTIGGLSLWGLLTIGLIAGTAGGSSTPSPSPTVTVTVYGTPAPGPTITVTETATPTANAQGQATSISADGVYVVGQDIPGGTWHSTGGQQCYEATLGSTDTSNIIDNNNFTGPDTVSLSGAKAFNISGGCTWQQVGH